LRYAKADLLASVVSSYDQTKTTVFGRVFSKTVDGKTALGPPLNKFVDIQSDTGITMAASNTYLSENGRLWVLSAEAGTTAVLLYSFNFDTGSYTYIGRVNIQMPDVAATTTVYRALKVLDSGTSGWKIFLVTTGSVTINGGTLLVNNLALSDFVQVGFPTIPFATGDDQKAVYFCQDPANLGAAHSASNIASAGAVLDKSGNRLYVHNGVAATHQYYVFATNVAPTWASASITGVAATDRIDYIGHPYNNGDQVTFSALTGGAGLVVGNTYFVVNRTANDFQVSATSGGAAINFTTDISSGTIGRGFGQTGALFLHKTGNLPALSGTLLLTDSEDFATPQHTTNSGQNCAFFGTTTTMYLGQLSELTNGATSWPSLVAANYLGAANEIVTPTATQVAWSNALDRAVISTGLVFIMKQVVNNQIDRIFGGTNNRFLEGLVNPEVVEFGPAANISAMDVENGWIAVMNLAAGQRGIMMADLRSDSLFEYSYIITKVFSTPQAAYRFITTTDALFEYTGSIKAYYRNSGFGSASGGWIAMPFAEDLIGLSAGSQTQLKLEFDTLGLDTSIPAQLTEAILVYDSQSETSHNWEISIDKSDNGNPSRTVFRLKEVYSSSVPALRYQAYDLSDVLVVNHTTTGNAARFDYSTDNGVTWSPLGTIPNTVGTLVRYTFATPPGVDVRPALKEA